MTHFKNSVLSQSECLFKIVFQFHTHNAKENILSKKNIFLFCSVCCFFFLFCFVVVFFFGKNAFFIKTYKFLEFLKISILPLGYQSLHTKEPFRGEIFLEISVREKCVPPRPTHLVLCYGKF